MKKAIPILLFIWLMGPVLLAQEAPKKDRYKMAGSYLGLEMGGLGPFSGFAPEGPSPGFGFGRITLGGLHFWTKADFYISFPIVTAPAGDANGFSYSEGIITGGRYIPFGLKRNTPHPYVGVNWTTPRWQVGDGPERRADRLGLEAGFITVLGKSVTLEAGVRYILNQQEEYPFGKDSFQSITLPTWGVHFGIKKHVDFTAGYGTDSGKAYVQSNQKKFAEAGALSTWTIQAGPSATISLRSTDFGEGLAHLNNKPSNLHPDLGVGYYFHKKKLTVNLSYRPMGFSGEAFGDTYNYRQHQVHLEAFKMLFDWKGFAPFAGVFAGVTAQKFETNIVGLAGTSEVLPSGGILLGWDIRPSAVDWYYLRTNLRYMPMPTFGGGAETFSTPQLEINFIQFVCFPQRFKLQKS